MSAPSAIRDALGRHRLAEVARRSGIPLDTDSGSVTVRCVLASHGHPDRTPSLRLYLDDDRYYCFGCSAKGDVVEWVRQSEGVAWREAIEILDSSRPLTNVWAGAAATTSERSRPARAAPGGMPGALGEVEAPDLGRTPPERVYAAMDAAWGYYTCPVLRRRGVRYLQGRGIDVALLETHTARGEVGHTPASPDGLVAALRSRGFDDEVVDAGLAQRRGGGGPLSDFYRQRVLIPIRDAQGRIVGIIGRSVAEQGRSAKYKNPPRTHLYDKSVNLYQPLPAPTRPEGRVIVVEGTLDAMAIAVAAIRSRQADRLCALTQSGRELSALQLGQVLRLHPSPPVLAFDGDAAGRQSAYRYSLAAAHQGRTVLVTALPSDHDPASWLAEHGDEGLSAWVLAGAQRGRRAERGRHDAPIPVAASTFASRYVEDTVGRRERSAAPTGPDSVLATEVIGL